LQKTLSVFFLLLKKAMAELVLKIDSTSHPSPGKESFPSLHPSLLGALA